MELIGVGVAGMVRPAVRAGLVGVVGATQACSWSARSPNFSNQGELIAALADTILPRTDTPGAADVGVGQFIEHILVNWQTAEEQVDLQRGLDELARRARTHIGMPFAAAAEAQRNAFLASLDGVHGAPGTAEHAYHRVKALTVRGYFTSERVQKEILKTPVIFSGFEGCIPFPQI